MMVETTTQHYGWTKPEITKSSATWGKFLNDDLDSMDALVFANQQGIVPIGAVTMFAGATAPANWLVCDGRSLPTTGGMYDALFAVLGYAHGGSGANFNLPNFGQKFPLGLRPGDSLGTSGGSLSVPIAVGNLPAHAHPIVDVAHNHTINDPWHVHGDPGHVHGVNDPQHHHGGIFRQTGSNNAGAVGTALGAGSQITDNAPTGISIAAAGANLQSASTNISLDASGTGLSTTQNIGSNTPLSVIPPFVALNFIVRYA